MTEKPLVSVIINCYNGEKYLREAIDSVIAQTYENWEMVFWDNQSTDSTRDIVESYGDSRIHYFYAPEHTPLGEARNLAVEKANGVYINFLDADDVWMPEKLYRQVELIVPGQVETIITGYDIIADAEAKKQTLYSVFMYNKNRLIKPVLTYEDILNGKIIVFSSVLFNKKIYVDVGGINPYFEQNEDYDIILKTSLKSQIAVVDGELTKYRIHGNNNSTTNGMLGYLENREIYKTLPPSNVLSKAIEVNETRIVAYQFSQSKSIVLFFKEVILKGRLGVFLYICIEKAKRSLLLLT